MLKIEDVLSYDITTPLAKKDAGIGSTSTDAYEWAPGNPKKPFSTISEFVYQGPEGVMLWAPTTGAATSSVHRTRAELKGQPYHFGDAPLHVFSVTSKMHKINWFGSIVVMQMHCDDGNDPTEKTFLTRNAKTGKFQLLSGLRTEASTKDPAKELLLDNVDIMQPFTIKYTITKDGLFTIEANQGSNTGKIEKQLSAKRAARPHVFHIGVYNQQDMGNAKEPAGDGSLIELMDFSEYHGEVPVVVPPRNLYDVQTDVDAVLASWVSGTQTKEGAVEALNTFKAEADTYPDTVLRASVYTQIADAITRITYVAPDEYETLQNELNTAKADYRSRLKALQTETRTQLNDITTRMKALSDKQRLAPIYTDIKAFKADIASESETLEE